MSVWRHNISLEARCVFGDKMCDWRDTVCVSGDTLFASICTHNVRLEPHCESRDAMFVYVCVCVCVFVCVCVEHNVCLERHCESGDTMCSRHNVCLDAICVWTLCLSGDTLCVCCRYLKVDAECVSGGTMCGWRHIMCLERHSVSDTMSIRKHNVCLETLCESGD